MVTCILFSHSHKDSEVKTNHMMVVAQGYIPCIMDETLLHQDNHAMQVSTVQLRNDKLASLLSNKEALLAENIPKHLVIPWSENDANINDILYDDNNTAKPDVSGSAIEYTHSCMKIRISTNDGEDGHIKFSVVDDDWTELCDIEDSFITMIVSTLSQEFQIAHTKS